MCEYEQRNLAIIEAIMLDLGVSDIEELPAKVHEIKVAAQRFACSGRFAIKPLKNESYQARAASAKVRLPCQQKER